MFKYIKEIWAGFLIGTANIIPGVSGGTILFLLGLYERTMGAVSGINAASVKALLKCAWGTVASNQRKSSLNRLIEQARALDLLFLAKLLLGVGAAIILLSDLMKYLLEKQLVNTYSFFLGLIAVSTIMTVKMLKTKKAVLLIHFIIGVVIVVALTASVDPSVKARIKSEQYKKIYTESTQLSGSSASSASSESGAASAGSGANSARFKYTGHYTVKEIAIAAGSGAIAICVMVLPGLSGSLVLILLGQYHEIISAISNLKTLQLDYFAFLSIICISMLISILGFARLVDYVFKRFYDGTVAVMIGLTAGSLYALWPFKKVVVIDQYVKGSGGITIIKDAVLQTNINIMPDNVTAGLLALLFCGVGVGIMVVLDRLGAEK